jgi:hypothetical protein
MHISSFDGSPHSGQTPGTSLSLVRAINYVTRRWHDYRLMRAIESVPYDVMKDVGFPAAGRAHEM